MLPLWSKWKGGLALRVVCLHLVRLARHLLAAIVQASCGIPTPLLLRLVEVGNLWLILSVVVSYALGYVRILLLGRETACEAGRMR